MSQRSHDEHQSQHWWVAVSSVSQERAPIITLCEHPLCVPARPPRLGPYLPVRARDKCSALSSFAVG